MKLKINFFVGKLITSRDSKGNDIFPMRKLPDDVDPFLALNCYEPEETPNLKCFRSGDGFRGNQHPALIAISILILRRHNHHAQQLAKVNNHWSDETPFQEAR